MTTDLDLMELAIATLFRLDEHGRLLTINEPSGGPAPRLFLGRTLAGDIPRFRHDLAPSVERDLRSLVASEPPVTDLRRLPACAGAIRDVLEQDGERTGIWHGPAWQFPPALPPSDAVRIAPGNVELVRETFPWLLTELPRRQPCFAVIQDGAAVSLCFSSRNTAQAAEAGVETLPAHRGHGYAPRAVAAWAGAVRRQGRIPLYSTSWDNAASQAVARRLGLILYGADLSFA